MSRRRYMWFLLLFLLFGVWSIAVQASDLIELKDRPGGLSIEPYLELAEEPANTPRLSIEQAQNLPFKQLENHSAHLGFTKKIYWFRFKYKTESTDTHNPILVFRYPLLDHLDVFLKNQDVWQHIETGAMRRFEVRSVPYRLINIRLPESLTPVEVYFRIATVTSFQAGASVYTEHDFQNGRVSEYIGLGFYYGALTIILAYNCAVFLFLREKVYLYYVGYLASYMLFQMSLNGMTQQYLFPEFSHLTKPTLLISAFFFAGFLYLFTETYLAFTYQNRLEKFVRLSRQFTFLLLILSLILPYQLSIIMVTTHCGIISPILGISVGVFEARNKRPGARYYLFGFSLFLLGSIIFALKTWNIIPINFFTEYAIQIGSILEVLILSSGLAYRMNQTLNQNRELAVSLDSKVREGQRLNQALAEEIDSREKLAEELVHKSESLAEESRRRAELERTLRLELESKVVLISDSIHHMNNPLNHIHGALAMIEAEHQKHQTFLHALMADQEPTEELRDVQRTFLSYDTALAAAQNLVKNAVERASDSVRTLRMLSGIDGYDRGAYLLGDIWQHLQRRTSLPIALLRDESIRQAGSIKIIGHPAIYAQAIDHLLAFAWDVGHQAIHVQLSQRLQSQDYVEILISAQQDITHGEDFAQIQASIEYLVRAYACKIERIDPKSFILCLPKAA